MFRRKRRGSTLKQQLHTKTLHQCWNVCALGATAATQMSGEKSLLLVKKTRTARNFQEIENASQLVCISHDSCPNCTEIIVFSSFKAAWHSSLSVYLSNNFFRSSTVTRARNFTRLWWRTWNRQPSAWNQLVRLFALVTSQAVSPRNFNCFLADQHCCS